MCTGLKEIGDRIYGFTKSGCMCTGRRTIGGKTYRFNSNGVMTSYGWIVVDGFSYIVNSDGTLGHKTWVGTGDKNWILGNDGKGIYLNGRYRFANRSNFGIVLFEDGRYPWTNQVPYQMIGVVPDVYGNATPLGAWSFKGFASNGDILLKMYSDKADRFFEGRITVSGDGLTLRCDKWIAASVSYDSFSGSATKNRNSTVY